MTDSPIDAGSMSQWKLMFLKFRQHRIAMLAFVVLLVFYFVALFAGFFAFNDRDTRFANSQNIPPMLPHLFSEKGFEGLFIYGKTRELNRQTFLYEYREDPNRIVKLRFFGEGFSHRLFGLIPTRRHLLVSEDPNTPFLPLGTDALGRCLFSRIVFGSQISLSIGLVGVFLSFVIGVVIGGISGYYGGIVDEVVQRVIDFIVSIPTVFDETRILDGVMGEYIVTARRYGGKWYLGGLTNWDARELSVDLSFLDEGEWVAEIVRDGVNAGSRGEDHVLERRSCKKGEPFLIKMAPGGGFAVKFSKQQ